MDSGLCMPFGSMVKFQFLYFIISLLASFSHQWCFFTLVVFHWSLSVGKSREGSRTRFSILADLSNAFVWIVSILPLISISSCPFSRLLGIFPSTPTTINITLKLMFLNVFNSLARSKYFPIFSLSSISTVWPVGTAKSIKQQFFLLTLGLVFCKIRASVCISKSQRILWVSFSRADSTFQHIQFRRMVKIQSFAQFPMNRLFHLLMPCLVLLFCLFAVLGNNVINVSSSSSHKLINRFSA